MELGHDDPVAPVEQRADECRAERAAAAADEGNLGHGVSASPVPVAAHFEQEFAPELRVLEFAPPERRHRAGVLLDAAHLRAEVRGVQVHGDAARGAKRAVGDLLASRSCTVKRRAKRTRRVSFRCR